MRDEEVETLTVSTLETVRVNSALEKSHCMHLRLGKLSEMADNRRRTEDQSNNFKK